MNQSKNCVFRKGQIVLDIIKKQKAHIGLYTLRKTLRVCTKTNSMDSLTVRGMGKKLIAARKTNSKRIINNIQEYEKT